MTMMYPLVLLCLAAVPPALCLTTTERANFTNSVTIAESGSNYIFSSNSVPDHAVGDFPNTVSLVCFLFIWHLICQILAVNVYSPSCVYDKQYGKIAYYKSASACFNFSYFIESVQT